MTINITMPQLGESVTEGTITKWLVQPGDKVKKYDPIAEVMTDKVNAEIPSSYDGTIVDLIAKEDETVAVGDVICTMSVIGEDESTFANDHDEPLENMPNNEADVQDTSQKKRYSPAVLKLSQEYGIDLNEVTGTGRGGRITRKDLLKIIEAKQVEKKDEKQKEVVKEQATIASEKIIEKQETTIVSSERTISSGVTDRVEEIQVSPIRRAIANNMVKSVQEIPHAWMMVEVDVTDLVKLRNKMKDEFFAKEKIKLTYLPFFIKATVEALKKYPQLNAKWAGDKIIQHKDIHISIAVATENELYVPVIKHADEKTIKGLAREIDDLATKVRTNKLAQEDVEGGTFTVNNTGTFGSIMSKPIINYPQAAIMTVEAIVKKPVVIENDAIAIRHIVNLCLSLDHRVLDGLICGKFLNEIKQTLENMNEKNTTLY